MQVFVNALPVFVSDPFAEPVMEKLGKNKLVLFMGLSKLEYFEEGPSWGGYESLATIGSHNLARSVRPFVAEGPLIRLHVGLEDPDDLIADLEAALARFGG